MKNIKPISDVPVYELIHSQKMVQYMWKYTIHMQTTQIPFSISFDEELDFRILARAVNIEIERNDCLRLRIFKQKGKIYQYFLPEYKLEKILVKTFDTKQELEEYFNSVSKKKLDVWAGDTFRIIFFKYEGNKYGVYAMASHMIMDAAAVFMFFNDLIAVYDSLKNKEPLPRPLAKYEDIIKKELADEHLEENIAAQKQVLADLLKGDKPPMFCGINGTKMLDRERKIRRNPELGAPSAYFPLADKSDCKKCHISKQDSQIIKQYADENKMSPEWLIQAGLRIYLSKINRNVCDTYLWVLCARRRTVKEKRCGGTLASPMPWREQLPPDMTFRQAVDKIAESQSLLFRNCDVPFTDIRDNEEKLFGYNIMQTSNSMMFSFLPGLEGFFNGREYEFIGFSMGYYCMPVYILTLYDKKNGVFKFNFIHRTSVYKSDEIESFSEGVAKTILEGVRNPDSTIKEITENLK